MRTLEVIALNAKDSIEAYKNGADRIELVENMEVGGISPSLETVKSVVDSVPIPVNVMIRYKHLNFEYDQHEMDMLISYLNAVKKLGINGVVFGSLNSDMAVNEEQLEMILEHCQGLDVTFHRAIDQSDLKYEQNFQQIDGKVTNVLTSGGLENSIEANIERLNAISNLRTTVLVGGGINRSNYKLLFDSLQSCDFHIGSLAYKNGDFNLGIDAEMLKAVKQYLLK